MYRVPLKTGVSILLYYFVIMHWTGIFQRGYILHDSHIKRSKKNDRFAEEQDPRTRQGNLELLTNGLLRLAGIKLGHVNLSSHLG